METQTQDTVKDTENGKAWSPEDYGFKLIIEGNERTKPVWKKIENKKVFIAIQLSETLWVVKKEVSSKEENGTITSRKLVKFHAVIDSRELADIYFTKGLRG